jgi:small subunit ribosomal protein S9
MPKENTPISNLDKELETLYQPKAQASRAQPNRKPAASKQKKKAVSKKNLVTKGKRKRAIARATLSYGGTGRVTFNGIDINLVKPSEIRDMILEPITATSAAGDIMRTSNISINVYGGGFSGQAQAARSAVAKAILKASASPESLRNLYMDYDRNLLIDDTRRVEPKKFRGPKARARFQKSYR